MFVQGPSLTPRWWGEYRVISPRVVKSHGARKLVTVVLFAGMGSPVGSHERIGVIFRQIFLLSTEKIKKTLDKRRIG